MVKVQARSGLGGGSQVRTSRNTLDVRGMRVHEAEAPCEALIAIGTASATGPPVVDPLAGMAIESTITTSEEVDRMLDLTESET